MKAISVSRVSTEEQKDAGNSLPAQAERIESYCKRKDFIITKQFSFDESAYKDRRDEFDKLIDFVREIIKKEKVAVCFDKVDRLSRSVFDKRVGILYDMALTDKIELHFVSDAQVINNQMSAVEKFNFGMSLGLAKYYSDAIGDNVKRAFEQKRRSGEWTGKVRLGYLNVHLDAEKRLRKDIIIDPTRGPLVQKIFELYATGNHSYESIRIKITELGLRSLDGYKISKSCIENIVKDSFYCGTAVSKKYGPYAHRYPKLVSREIFERCQEIRNGRRRVPSKVVSKDFIFKGVLHCPNCNCLMSPEIKKGLFIYYACSNAKRMCKKVYIPEKNLLKPIYEVLERFESIPEQVQHDLVEELRKSTEHEIVFHKAQTERIRGNYDALKMRELLRIYMTRNMRSIRIKSRL